MLRGEAPGGAAMRMGLVRILDEGEGEGSPDAATPTDLGLIRGGPIGVRIKASDRGVLGEPNGVPYPPPGVVPWRGVEAGLEGTESDGAATGSGSRNDGTREVVPESGFGWSSVSQSMGSAPSCCLGGVVWVGAGCRKD